SSFPRARPIPDDAPVTRTTLLVQLIDVEVRGEFTVGFPLKFGLKRGLVNDEALLQTTDEASALIRIQQTAGPGTKFYVLRWEKQVPGVRQDFSHRTLLLAHSIG